MLQIALFFNITQAPWLASGNISLHWQADEIIRPDSPNDGNWWIPDIADIQQRAISVRSIPNMVDYLLRISDAEVAQWTEQVQVRLLCCFGTQKDHTASDCRKRAAHFCRHVSTLCCARSPSSMWTDIGMAPSDVQRCSAALCMHVHVASVTPLWQCGQWQRLS